MAGLGFRVAAVPFHFYAPDVYQGSPTVIAALLAWVPKAIGFLAMIRTLTAVVSVGRPTEDPLAHQAVVLAWIIAAVTMTLGNTVALLAGEPQAAAGLLVDRPRRLPDDRRDGRLPRRPGAPADFLGARASSSTWSPTP